MSETVILPPESDDISHGFRSSSRRLTAAVQPIVLSVFATIILTILLWSLGQFFSFRGVLDVVASRLALAISIVCVIAFLWIGTRFLSRRRDTWFWIGVVATLCLSFALDGWASKHQSLNPQQLAAAQSSKPQEIVPVPRESFANEDTERHVLAGRAHYIGKGLGELAANYSNRSTEQLLEFWRTKEFSKVKAIRDQYAKNGITDDTLDEYLQTANAVGSPKQIGDAGLILLRMSDSILKSVPPVGVVIDGQNKVRMQDINLGGSGTIIHGKNDVTIKNLDNRQNSPAAKPQKAVQPN